MTTRKILVASTKHLSPRTARFLSQTTAVDWPVPGGHYRDFGFFFHVVDENGVGPDFAPKDLFDLLEYACNQGFTYVSVESGADTCPDLAVYEREATDVSLDGYQLHKPSSLHELDAKKSREALAVLTTSGEFNGSDIKLSARIGSVVEALEQRLPEGNREAMAVSQRELQHLADLASAFPLIVAGGSEAYSETRSAIETAYSRVSEWVCDFVVEDDETRVYQALGEACYRLEAARALVGCA
jgi:hypothetical protein